jgi:bisphosphoglycerate-dependent phosphoglycerate mutase
LVRYCREGYRLSKEIPPISDKYFWIENDKYYLSGRQFNEEFQRYCKEQIKINHRGWEEALGESKELNRIYYLIQHITNNDDVYDTKYNGFSKTFKKRLCLKELRKRLGEENYYKGYVPPCVPIWRFTEF